MKKFIIITSIFYPTVAVKKFAKLNDYELIVVGDNKTPKDWTLDNTRYLSLVEQKKLNFKIVDTLPINHYCRKMIGYLIAINNGAEIIIDTDDDNIPKKNWGFPEFSGNYDFISEDKGFINIYKLFTNQKIWPRGLPLKYINDDIQLNKIISKRSSKIGVWQALADEDPDVDAIYRLTYNSPCFFDDRDPIVLGKGTISPFNTQNTVIIKDLFPLLYLPTFVTFRFTDILRGLIAQPIMWLYNYNLGFTKATVIQKRNFHDYMKDFLSEIPMFEHSEKVIEIVSTAITKSDSLNSNLYNAYHSLYKSKIVIDDELVTLEAWLDDLEKIR